MILNYLDKDFYYIFFKKIFYYFPCNVSSFYFDSFGKVCLFLYYNNTFFYDFYLFIYKSSFFRLKSCVEFTVVDLLEYKYRYKLIYVLISIIFNNRLILNCLYDLYFKLNSLSFLFLSLNWFEREVFDMFGIFFFNHSNLRGLLLDYGFEGNPLLKDFPCFGFKEVYYSSNYFECVYLNIKGL